MTKVSYHMVHYREFKATGLPAPISLENLLRKRLSANGASGAPRWEAINDRLMSPEGNTGYELVLNRVADLSSAVFG